MNFLHLANLRHHFRLTNEYLDDRVSQIKDDVMKKEKLLKEKSDLYRVAMQAKKLTPEQIRKLKELDYKIQRVQVDTKFDYEEVSKKIANPQKYQDEVMSQSCTFVLGIGGCRNYKNKVWKTKMEYDTQETRTITKEIPVYVEKVHFTTYVALHNYSKVSNSSAGWNKQAG